MEAEGTLDDQCLPAALTPPQRKCGKVQGVAHGCSRVGKQTLLLYLQLNWVLEANTAY